MGIPFVSVASYSTAEAVYQREETRQKMTVARKTVAARLKVSQNTYATITTFQEVTQNDLDRYEARHGHEKGTRRRV